VTTFDRRLRKVFPLLTVDVKVHCNILTILLIHILLLHFWHNIKIIRFYLNCKAEPSTTVRPIYITVALPDDGATTGRNMS